MIPKVGCYASIYFRSRHSMSFIQILTPSQTKLYDLNAIINIYKQMFLAKWFWKIYAELPGGGQYKK